MLTGGSLTASLRKVGQCYSRVFQKKNRNAMPSPPLKNRDRIVWIDCEMTGLDPNKCVLLEVAAIVTNYSLEPINNGIDLVIHQPPEALNLMIDYVKAMHEKSGLTEAVAASKMDLKETESRILDYVKAACEGTNGKPLVAGNSIRTDLHFLNKYMPTLMKLFHYRIIDVSSFKSVIQEWRPEVASSLPRKKSSHRALSDIIESIEELKFYKKNIFNL